MKFGGVSTLLLSLSPWYNGDSTSRDNGLAKRGAKNLLLLDAADHPVSTVAPQTATNVVVEEAKVSRAQPTPNTIPKFGLSTINVAFPARQRSNRHRRVIKDSPIWEITRNQRTKSQRRLKRKNTVLKVANSASETILPNSSSQALETYKTSSETTEVSSDFAQQPMVAPSGAAEIGSILDNFTKSRDNLTQLEQRVLVFLAPPIEYNRTVPAPNTTRGSSGDLTTANSTYSTLTSSLWNWTAAALDELQWQINGSLNYSDLAHSVNHTFINGSSSSATYTPFSAINSHNVTASTPTSTSSEALSTTSFDEVKIEDFAVPSAALAVLLALFCVFTVFGNVLVMVAVARERYLHTVTNYFVVSLAVADCLVGSLVMPFSAVHETMSRVWIFGRDWCDAWHSLDVLGSTASILNLCIISLDRYLAITDPITYPSKMTPRKSCILIVAVWVCASLISFPAIAWWRAVSPSTSGSPESINETSTSPFPSVAATHWPLSAGRPACTFTEDIGYLVFSSIISFYGPLTVMVFTYYRIYRAAAAQTRSLRLGTKQVLACNGEESMELTLRIHRGGGGAATGGGKSNSGGAPTHSNGNGSGGRRGYHPVYPASPPATSAAAAASEYLSDGGAAADTHSNSSCSSSVRVVPKNLKHFSFSRKLARMAKEQKAAKTLGIVMGVFVLCWMPFFLCNVLLGLCPERCFRDPALVSSVVTWLGWINSGMNPVIYACWSRDFRRAFSKILCGCCPRFMFDGGIRGGGAANRSRRHYLRSRVCQSISTPMSSTCSAECVRL